MNFVSHFLVEPIFIGKINSYAAFKQILMFFLDELLIYKHTADT